VFATLARKEFLANILRLRFAVAAGLCLLLVCVSLTAMLREYAGEVRAYSASVAMHREGNTRIESEWSLAAGHVVLDRPPAPGSILFSGLERSTPRSADLCSLAWDRDEFYSDLDSSPTGALFPVADLGFIIGIAISLVAVVFSYDAISGEREGGTLRLLMSFPVARASILAAKWLGGCVGILLPLSACYLLVCIVMLLHPGVRLSGAEWAGVALAYVASVLYVSAVYSLGLCVSASVRRSSTSVMTLLLVWVILTLLVPNLAPYAAGMAAPVPSYDRVLAEKGELQAGNEREWWDQWRELREERDLSDDQRNQRRATLTIPYLQDNERELRRIDAMFSRKLVRHDRLARRISRASPFACFLFAGAELCGTGLAAADDVIGQMLAYRKEYGEWALAHFEEHLLTDQPLDLEELPREMPRFAYEPMAVDERIAAAVVDIAALVGYNIVFLLGSVVAFLRSEPI